MTLAYPIKNTSFFKIYLSFFLNADPEVVLLSNFLY